MHVVLCIGAVDLPRDLVGEIHLYRTPGVITDPERIKQMVREIEPSEVVVNDPSLARELANGGLGPDVEVICC